MGRLRQYELEKVPGFFNPDAGGLVAVLNEVTARFLDMLRDLSVAQWNAPVEGFWGSIGQLTAHCLRGEAGWVSSVAGGASRIQRICQRLTCEEEKRPSHLTAREMIGEVCHCRQLTVRQLASLKNIDAEHQNGDRVVSVRGILHHQIWHWTFHHGQLSAMRQILGVRPYKWRLAERIVPIP